jgi:hypothetical protein
VARQQERHCETASVRSSAPNCRCFFYFYHARRSLLSPLLTRAKTPLLIRSPPDVAAGRRAGALLKGLLLERGGSEPTAPKRRLGPFPPGFRLDPDNRRPLSALLSNLADRRGSASRFWKSSLPSRTGDSAALERPSRPSGHRPADAARHCKPCWPQPDDRPLARCPGADCFPSGQSPRAPPDARAARPLRDRDSPPSVQWAVHFSGRRNSQPGRWTA